MRRPGLLALLILAPALFAASPPPIDPAKAPPPVRYPLQTCIVTGEHLNAGETVTYVYPQAGQPDRELRFCCHKCLRRFKADPAKYLQRLAAEAATQAARKN